MNNKTSAAEAVLLKAIDIEETVANFNNLGVAYYKLSKYEEACKYFEKSHSIAYKKDYSFRPYLNLGMSFTKLKKKKEAENIAEFLLNSDEAKSDGYIGLIDIALLYFFNENYEKAISLFIMAFDEYVIYPNEFGMYLFSLINLKIQKEAKEFLNRAIKINKDRINEISDIEDMTIGDKNIIIGDLKHDINQFKILYQQITSGVKPQFVFVPYIEEQCYLFGCTQHENPHYIKKWEVSGK